MAEKEAPLLAYQKANRKLNRKKHQNAMSAEIDEHGFYPSNNGRVPGGALDSTGRQT
jgi:hypothetical protein